MQSVEKRVKRPLRHVRLWVLLALLLALLGCLAAYSIMNRPVEVEDIPSANTYGEVMTHETGEVARLSIALRNGDNWTVEQTSDGTLMMADEPDWVISDTMSLSLLSAVAVISYDDILTENPEDYQPYLADFGLDNPRITATVDYTDGQQVVMYIGNQAEGDEDTWSYMVLAGDDRLFALDKGTVDNLNIDKKVLRSVVQPTIHKARIDSITLTGADGNVSAAWALDGSITDTDVSARWRMLAPYIYPADGETLANLRENLANLRLGAYEGELTDDTAATYGLDDPRFVLTIHQAAGTTGTADEDGVYNTVDWPESTLVFTVGAAKNDNVDYVAVDGSIYLMSHYSLDVFMSLDPLSTLSRYPVMVALSQLSSLTVEANGQTDVYVILREEQVAENNELVTDEDGNVVYDIYCDLNGEAYTYASFEADYNKLLLVTVTGLLPDGWTSQTEPHTTFTFVSTSGITHTVALCDFDALHDAVLIDGHGVFYLIKGGMVMGM